MGGIAIVGGADPEKKLVILAFSTQVNRIELTPEGARDVAKMLVSRSFIADGTMPPEAKPNVIVSDAPKQVMRACGADDVE